MEIFCETQNKDAFLEALEMPEFPKGCSDCRDLVCLLVVEAFDGRELGPHKDVSQEFVQTYGQYGQRGPRFNHFELASTTIGAANSGV